MLYYFRILHSQQARSNAGSMPGESSGGSRQLYPRIRKNVEVQDTRGWSEVADAGCWDRSSGCPGRLKVGPGFAKRALPRRRAGAPRRRRRRRFLPLSLILPPFVCKRRSGYARRHRARQKPRGSRGPSRRESVLRRVAARRYWLWHEPRFPRVRQLGRGPLSPETRSVRDNPRHDRHPQRLRARFIVVTSETGWIVITRMYEWDRPSVRLFHSVNLIRGGHRKSRRSWDARGTSGQVSTFTFLGKSEVRNTRVLDSVTFLEFAASFSTILLLTTCPKNFVRGRDFRLFRAWPFEGARLFTGEATRVSWTPVKLASTN